MNIILDQADSIDKSALIGESDFSVLAQAAVSQLGRLPETWTQK